MSKKNKNIQKKQVLKEIRMQPKISEHDLNFKTKHVQQFLEEGHKVKVTVRFRGRELSHLQLGEDLLKAMQTMLNDMKCKFNVDREPAMEGRMMSVLLSPTSKK